MAELYTYQVARVRARELALLSRQDIDQLMAAKTCGECIRVLNDKGWGSGGEKTAEEIFAAEDKKLWDFIGELIKDSSPFNVLLYPADYNNLKAAVKLAATGGEPHNVFKSGGTVPPEKMLEAAKNNNFSSLPPKMAAAAENAYRTMLQTRDGQLCDIILDKACLEEIYGSGSASKDKLIKEYADLSVAVSNIKIAVRCQKTGKSVNFIKDALVPCGGLDISSLASAANKGPDEIYAYLSLTKYSDAVDKIKESPSTFEKWCDDRVMALVKSQKMNPFTIGPIMAYIIARRNEISTVRIILSGKLNHIGDEIIRERLRDMYV